MNNVSAARYAYNSATEELERIAQSLVPEEEISDGNLEALIRLTALQQRAAEQYHLAIDELRKFLLQPATRR